MTTDSAQRNLQRYVFLVRNFVSPSNNLFLRNSFMENSAAIKLPRASRLRSKVYTKILSQRVVIRQSRERNIATRRRKWLPFVTGSTRCRESLLFWHQLFTDDGESWLISRWTGRWYWNSSTAWFTDRIGNRPFMVVIILMNYIVTSFQLPESLIELANGVSM